MAVWRMALLALMLVWPATALAQDDDEFFDDDEEAEEGDHDDGHLEDDGDDGDDDEDGDLDDEDDGDDGDSGESEPGAGGAREWAFGPYLRFQWVPSFMLQLFTEEAPTVSNAAYGVAATYRPEGGSVNFEMGIGYAGYSFNDAFRATGDPVEDTEWLDSDLGMIHVTGSILWEAELIADMLSLEYGIGLDFGVVTGSLVRTEAFRDQNGAWGRCVAPGNPGFAASVGTLYCESNTVNGLPVPGTAAYDETGAHYGVEEERVPPVALVPMLPRIGIAYSPIKELVGKFDIAYGIFQFSIGISIAYVPDI